MARMRWTSTMIDDLQNRRIGGQTWAEIASAYDCTLRQVKEAYYKHVHRFGGYLEPRHSWTNEALAELAQYKRNGFTDGKIADIKGLEQCTIARTRKRYGINRHGEFIK